MLLILQKHFHHDQVNLQEKGETMVIKKVECVEVIVWTSLQFLFSEKLA